MKPCPHCSQFIDAGMLKFYYAGPRTPLVCEACKTESFPDVKSHMLISIPVQLCAVAAAIALWPQPFGGYIGCAAGLAIFALDVVLVSKLVRLVKVS